MKRTIKRATLPFLLAIGLAVGLAQAQTTLQVMSATVVENPEGTVEKAIADDFMKQNPDIKIQFIGVPMNNIYQELSTRAIGGELPCVFTNTPEFIATAYDMGMTTNLSDVFSKSFIDGFYPVLLRQSTFDGKLQFVPWFSIPMGLLYRADWFKAAGLTPPNTWDEFLKDAQALTKDTNGDGKINQWGFAMIGSKNGSGESRFVQILRSFGAYELKKNDQGQWITQLDSPQAVQAFTFFGDLATKYHVVPPGPTQISYGEAVNLMANNQTAMMLTGPHSIGAILARNPDLKGKIYSAPLPMGEQHVSSSGMLGWSISPTCKNKDAAVKYITFLTNKQNQLRWNAVTGRMPALVAAGQDPQITGPVYNGFVKSIQYIQDLPAVPYYSKVYDAMGEAYQSILVGGVSPKVAADRAAQQVRQAIKNAP